MKYMVLKVAAGVCLAIAAAFGVYKILQVWEARKIAAAFLEQQDLAAKTAQEERQAQQARIKEAANRLNTVDVAEVLKHCGPPIEERYNKTVTTDTLERRLSYLGEDGHKVVVLFWCTTGYYGCLYQEMYKDETGTVYEPHTPEDYETFLTTEGSPDLPGHLAGRGPLPTLHSGHLGAVKELPCLVPAYFSSLKLVVRDE